MTIKSKTKVKAQCRAVWSTKALEDLNSGGDDVVHMCDKDSRAKGLCWGHYQQERRHQPFGALDRTPTHVQLPPPRVEKHVEEQLKILAELDGSSLYALMARVLTDFVEGKLKR